MREPKNDIRIGAAWHHMIRERQPVQPPFGGAFGIWAVNMKYPVARTRRDTSLAYLGVG